MSDYESTSIGRGFADLQASPQFDGYSGVEIVIDDDTSVFSGSRMGRVLTIENPWGTQEQADNILASIQGFQYQPFTATDALLNPAAELGDGISMNGLYSGVYSLSRDFDQLMAADVSAPQDEEIDHEYPFEPKEDREITRKFMSVESEFSLQSNLIAAKVSKTSPEGQTAFSWELDDDSWEVKSNGDTVFRVDSTGAEVKGIITATSGKIGGFNIGSNAIWNGISSFNNPDDIYSGVYLGTDGIRLGRNFTVSTSGTVTANNIVLTGNNLQVGGGSISAGNLRVGAGGGLTFNNASSQGGTYFVPTFRALSIHCDSVGANTVGANSGTFSELVARDRFYLGSVRPLTLIPISSASYVVGY